MKVYKNEILVLCKMKKTFALLFIFLFFFSSQKMNAEVFTVTNTHDSGPGSLRQAIKDNNFHRGQNKIVFNIPGKGPFKISPKTDLDHITTTVEIDGYTQPGAKENKLTLGSNAVLQIIINGSHYSVGDGVKSGYGLVLFGGAENSIIRGLVINEWIYAGLYIGSNNIKVLGNFIGTDVTGTKQQANQAGIAIIKADNVVVGSKNPADFNVICGSFSYFFSGSGIFATAIPSKLTIQGNLIGTDKTGTKALGNSCVGISLVATKGVLIGGTEMSQSNLISGQTIFGIQMSGTSKTIIQNNFIGTNVKGVKSLGNLNTGISLDGFADICSDNKIINNLISGNGTGIAIGDVTGGHNTVINNVIQGNLIGVDYSGQKELGNLRNGIYVRDNKNSILNNIISGNGFNGIIITSQAKGNEISGNFIGLNILGNAAIGNKLNGIQLGTPGGKNNALSNSVGGKNKNVISGNGQNGILVTSFSTKNVIQNNYIGTDKTGKHKISNKHDNVEVLCSKGNTINKNSP